MMEMKGNRKVDDVWNALKLDTTRAMRDISSSRITTVDWNSFHIRDAVKPKKKIILSAKLAREDSSFFADYSLTEASQIFLNSEGGLEVGCPSYECKDKCRSSKRKEGHDDTVEGGGTPQPDFVTLQYAKLKAAYQEKVRREKLAKCEVVSEDAIMAVDDEYSLKEDDEESLTVTKPPPQMETLKSEEDPHDETMLSSGVNLNCDDVDDVQTNYHHHLAQDAMAVGENRLKEHEESSSTKLPPPRTEALKKEEDVQDDRPSCTVDLNCDDDDDDVVQTDYQHHLVQEHLNEEKFEKIKALVGKGVLKCGSITDVGLGESGKGSDKEDEESSSTRPPLQMETLKNEEDLQNDRSSCTVHLACDDDDDDDVVQTDRHHHLVQEHLSEEKFDKIQELISKGVLKCGSITDVGLGESGKGSDPSRKGNKEVVDGVTTGAPRSVRFSFPEGASKSLGSSDGTDANALPDGEGDGNQKLSNAVTRDLNCLTDASPGVRLAALQRLQSILFGGNPKPDEENKSGQCAEEDELLKESWRHTLGWAAEELVIKPLLRRFGDPSEKCRMLAIAILKKLLEEVPSAVIVLLPYVLPVISERMPLKVPLQPSTDEDYLKELVEVQATLVETSEDVRLQLMQFMHLVLKQAPRLIQAFASDVASILVAATFDKHPEVLLETFPTLELFGEIMEYRLKPIGKQLVKVCHRSLSHNHGRVRVAALKAICRLTMCGSHDAIYELTAYRDPNLIPIKAFYGPCPKTQYMALLAVDKNGSVREELYRTVACWLCELNERREHECRLLPYLLAGFQDPSPHLQTLAFELMEAVGQQYEDEYVDEVKDTQTYLTEDIDNIECVGGTPLLHPFQRRPCLGARIMVKNVAAIILHAIAGDMECWTSGTKELAANFLLTLLLFVESNITMHLQPLLKLMHRALAEPTVAPKILETAKLLGFFVDPDSYLPVIMPLVNGDVSADVSVQTLGHALQLLAGTLAGSKPEQIVSHIPEICSTITDHHIMTSIQQSVNDAVVAVAEQLIRAWEVEACMPEVTSMLWLLLNAVAAADFCSRSHSKAESAIRALALATGNSSEEALIASYLSGVLDILPHPRKWALRSLDALVFCRLLQYSSSVEVEKLDRLIKTFQRCIQKSVDDDVKIWLVKEVKLYLSQGPLQWADGKRHVGHMWESFLIPCLQHGDTLIIPTLEAIQKIWSRPLPKSIISTESFQDSAQNILRNVEKVLEKNRPKDEAEETTATNHEGDSKQNEDNKRCSEQMRKLMKPPTDAPIRNAILLKCYETISYILSRVAKKFNDESKA